MIHEVGKSGRPLTTAAVLTTKELSTTTKSTTLSNPAPTIKPLKSADNDSRTLLTRPLLSAAAYKKDKTQLLIADNDDKTLLTRPLLSSVVSDDKDKKGRVKIKTEYMRRKERMRPHGTT